jgi:hypothetical protein
MATRRWFQFHLSTLVLNAALVGLLMLLNLTPEIPGSHGTTSSSENFDVTHDDVKGFIAGRSQFSINPKLQNWRRYQFIEYRHYGWPLSAITAYAVVYFTDDEWQRAPESEQWLKRLDWFEYGVYWHDPLGRPIVDLLFWLALMIGATIVSERIAGRKRQHPLPPAKDDSTTAR